MGKPYIKTIEEMTGICETVRIASTKIWESGHVDGKFMIRAAVIFDILGENGEAIDTREELLSVEYSTRPILQDAVAFLSTHLVPFCISKFIEYCGKNPLEGV